MKFGRNVLHVNRIDGLSRILDLTSHFKMAAMTSFQADRWCHAVNKHEALAVPLSKTGKWGE